MLDFPLMNWRTHSPKLEQHSLSLIHVPSLLDPIIAKIRHTRYSSWRRNLFHNTLFFHIPSLSSEELALSRLARSEPSRLSCHSYSLFLPSYLCRIKWKENSSCNVCPHPLQDLTHLLLDHPASEPLRRAIFGTTCSILTSDLNLGAWPDYWVSPPSSSALLR